MQVNARPWGRVLFAEDVTSVRERFDTVDAATAASVPDEALRASG